jgi:hypothetical protein
MWASWRLCFGLTYATREPIDKETYTMLGPIAEAVAELFMNVQLRKHRVLNRLFWIIIGLVIAVGIVSGLDYSS